ncbi:MAG: NADPH-dependent F420 reductase [Dehalococcoidia bacterium]|nr:NADPH-dependent F420 reductase [Dehalococcoidia bacterium]MSQ17757.1 NADPH-dependent F420 reductase [Dehalococcoidia bacterium]
MLAFLGGTGPEGRGLALRLARAGHGVIIGSRDEARAQAAAAELHLGAGAGQVLGADNTRAASQGEVVFLAVPYEAQRLLLEQVGHLLAGKVVVDVIAPMRFQRGRGASAVDVPAGSAAQEAQQMLPGALVVAAFQTVSAEELLLVDHSVAGDVIVCSDHQPAKDRVMELVRLIPDLRPVDGGGLANAKYVEQITPLLVNINRIYKVHAGIQVVGL